MALSGVHFEFGYQKKVAANTSPILGLLTASETVASAGPTTVAAPRVDVQGDPVVNVIASADVWVTFGENPADPSSASSARRYILSMTPTPCFVNAGDKARWALA